MHFKLLLCPLPGHASEAICWPQSPAVGAPQRASPYCCSAKIVTPGPSPTRPDTQTRQKSSAAVQTMDSAAVLTKISGPMTPATADIIHNIQIYCVVPNGVQAPGV